MAEDKLSKVLQLIKIKGPVIPSQINKEIEVDVLMGSAILSELVDKGQLRLSYVKIGGSPLYYAPGQESRLQEFSKYLNSKDKLTYDLLREKKVLKDKSLETLQRVSLRQIKDFAKPLNVRVGEESTIFWKWYLISNEEAGGYIRNFLPKTEPKPQLPEKKQSETQINAQKRADVAESIENRDIGRQKIQEKPVEKLQTPQSQVHQERAVQSIQNQTAQNVQKQEKIVEKTSEAKKEKQEKLGSDIKSSEDSLNIEIPKDKFFRKIKKYFDDNSIKIVEHKIIRKESDIEFTVKILSSVGSLTYFCKAKNKKKYNDGDISSVFIEGQRKKMPVLFLITGDLTKKAKDVLESEFKNMYVKRI